MIKPLCNKSYIGTIPLFHQYFLAFNESFYDSKEGTVKNSKMMVETDVVIFPMDNIDDNSDKVLTNEKRNDKVPANSSSDTEIKDRTICAK